MNTKNNNPILIAGAVVMKEDKGKGKLWMVVKQTDEAGWEMPKTTVRKGESSVRAVIRMMGEQAGMNVRVLEEANRMNGAANINGRKVDKRTIYYLMLHRVGSETIGFAEYLWLDYSKAKAKLENKREKETLELAKQVLKEWEKKKSLKQIQEEEVAEEEVLV